MLPSYWPWAVRHASFVVNRLCCIRNKKGTNNRLHKGLRQPHPEKIDSETCPGLAAVHINKQVQIREEFQLRAEKGWFVGFKPTPTETISFNIHIKPQLRGGNRLRVLQLRHLSMRVMYLAKNLFKIINIYPTNKPTLPTKTYIPAPI